MKETGMLLNLKMNPRGSTVNKNKFKNFKLNFIFRRQENKRFYQQQDLQTGKQKDIQTGKEDNIYIG